MNAAVLQCSAFHPSLAISRFIASPLLFSVTIRIYPGQVPQLEVVHLITEKGNLLHDMAGTDGRIRDKLEVNKISHKCNNIKSPSDIGLWRIDDVYCIPSPFSIAKSLLCCAGSNPPVTDRLLGTLLFRPPLTCCISMQPLCLVQRPSFYQCQCHDRPPPRSHARAPCADASQRRRPEDPAVGASDQFWRPRKDSSPSPSLSLC